MADRPPFLSCIRSKRQSARKSVVADLLEAVAVIRPAMLGFVILYAVIGLLLSIHFVRRQQ